MSRRLLVVFFAVVVFGLLAAQVLWHGPVTVLDRDLTLYLDAHRTDGLTRFMRGLSDLHQTSRVLGATAVVAGLLALLGRGRWILMLAVVPIGMLLNVGLKHLFARARPVLDEPLVHIATYSFPSGHGVASTVFYGALWLLVAAHVRNRAARLAMAATAVVMIALVCFSRVYLGVHYFSDVLAAVCEGVVWLALWSWVVRRQASRSSSSR